MSILDDIKRSLGFEGTENNGGTSITEAIGNIFKSPNGNNAQHHDQPQYAPNPQQHGVNHTTAPNPPVRPAERPAPVYEDYEDDYVIIPEQPFYEIVLIRPKTIDDINYVVDQVIEEKNPVILDLSFLEKESTPNFKLAGDKIKQMRVNYGAQALLLSRTEEKNLIIISPKKVKVVNKG
jgi:SepF-like predicted cell division protein (DUF552 family)